MSSHLEPVPDQPVEKAVGYGQLSNYGLYRTGSYTQREYLTALRGRRASEAFREMLNDATVGAMIFAIDKILRRVEWEVEPTPSSDNGEVTDSDIERADFLNTCIDDMSHSWEGFVADALTMLPFGFAYLEIVYKTREETSLTAPATKRTRHPDGKIGWRKFVLVPQETIWDWQLDEYGGVQAACQQTGWGGQVDIPIDKALLFRTDYRTPTGESVLRSSYTAWYRKQHIEQIEGIGVERDLAGLPVIYAEDAYLQRHSNTLRDIARNIRVDEQMGVVLPDMRDDQGNRTLEVTLLSSGGGKAFNTSEIINRYKRDIASTVLMDLILLGQDKIGTQALASEKRDLSDTVLQCWLNEIAAVLNDHAVPRLFELNGEPLEFLPRICPGELRPTDVNEFATALKDVAGAGFMLAGDPEIEAEVRRRLGLPAMDEEVHQQMQDDMLNPPEPPPMLAPGQMPPGEQPPSQAEEGQSPKVDKGYIKGPDGKFRGSTGEGGDSGGGDSRHIPKFSAEQQEALVPAKRYNAKLKAETEAKLKVNRQGEVLADVVNDFQHGEGAKSLRAGITKELNNPGSGGPKAQVMIGAIRSAPETNQVLYRGMRVPDSHKALVEKYKEGSTIDMNLSSFSTSAGVAQTFAGGAGRGGTSVIIGVVGSKKALPIQNLSKNSSVFSEKEFVTGGRFRVIGIEKQAGFGTVISLAHVETL